MASASVCVCPETGSAPSSSRWKIVPREPRDAYFGSRLRSVFSEMVPVRRSNIESKTVTLFGLTEAASSTGVNPLASALILYLPGAMSEAINCPSRSVLVCLITLSVLLRPMPAPVTISIAAPARGAPRESFTSPRIDPSAAAEALGAKPKPAPATAASARSLIATFISTPPRFNETAAPIGSMTAILTWPKSVKKALFEPQRQPLKGLSSMTDPAFFAPSKLSKGLAPQGIAKNWIITKPICPSRACHDRSAHLFDKQPLTVLPYYSGCAYESGPSLALCSPFQFTQELFNSLLVGGAGPRIPRGSDTRQACQGFDLQSRIIRKGD